MTQNEQIVFIMLAINYITAFLYLIAGMIPFRRKKPEKRPDRAKTVICFLVLCLCPVVGLCFFVISYIVRKIFFRREVDLSDVIFGKDKAASEVKGDEEFEKNIVPLAEALAITDKQNLRWLMINIIKEDVGQHLKSISEALNSEDSETAHYAASVLRDEINDFRSNVSKLYFAIKEESEGAERIQLIHTLLKYMDSYIRQDIFADVERGSFVETMDEVLEILYDIDREEVRPEELEWVSMRLMESDLYELSEKWTEVAKYLYPDELSSYTSAIKLYFKTGDQVKFFREVEALKESDVVMDKETLELIRTFL